jgi:hypothetical protein
LFIAPSGCRLAVRRGLWFVPLALGAGVGLGVGCASTSSDGSPGASNATAPSSDLPGDGTSAPTPNDAAAIAFLHGNPLCNMSSNSCSPDSETIASCSPDVDAGLAAASALAAACRIDLQASPDGGSGYVPTCFDPTDAARAGVDGATCASGADCAPGYDCIIGAKSGECRHYCCSGSCDNTMSKSGGPTFCDIQQLFSLDRKKPLAPVCMPIKKCRLLMPGDCAASPSPDVPGESCAVVTEAGDTGCVAEGKAMVRESCDTEHCAGPPDSVPLTCLGTAGDRHCYQLCTTDGNQCPSGQTCTTGSLFQDTTYGVCKDSPK